MATAFHLATVDYWPERQLLFVSAARSGAVDILRIPVHAKQAVPEHVKRLEEPARRIVVRLAIDRTRGRLWVADFQAVYIYPLKPFAPATVVHIPNLPYGDRVNDLSLDDMGNGYVHTRGGALIYRVDADKLQLHEWLEPFKAAQDSGGFQFTTRVLHTKDQRYLLLPVPRDGRLLRIDIASRQITTVQMERPLDVRCGLLFWAEEWRGGTDASSPKAKAVDCLGRWSAEVEFDAGMTRATARLVSP